MPNLKCLARKPAAGSTRAAAIGGGSAGRRPCAPGAEKMTTNFLQRKYYPPTVPAVCHLAAYSAFGSPGAT